MTPRRLDVTPTPPVILKVAVFRRTLPLLLALFSSCAPMHAPAAPSATLPPEFGPLFADAAGPNKPASASSAPAPDTDAQCNPKANPANRSMWQLPIDVRFTNNGIEPEEVGDAVSLYHPYNTQFAWQAFIALNWPAGSDGQPDPARAIGGDGGDRPTFWESWINAEDVFRKNGAKPLPWGSQSPIPTTCANVPKKTADLVFEQDDESQTSHDSANGHEEKKLEENRAPPVVDQNGRWVRYEIYLNRSDYQYIVDNQLYSVEGQKKFKASGKPLLFPTGSIELKIAWKELGDGDDPKKFHVREGVFVNADGSCSIAKVGMVALHIKYKTPRSPNHFWATFEHNANLCQTNPFTGAVSSGSFCNKCCLPNPPANCPLPEGGCKPFDLPPKLTAEPPEKPAEPSHVPPSELSRVTPIPVSIGQLNSLMQDLLGEMGSHEGSGQVPQSVWTNYELINAQWLMPFMPNVATSWYRGASAMTTTNKVPQYFPRIPGEAWCNQNAPQCDKGRDCPMLVQPPIVANTIIEPYNQASSSCLGCHQAAKTRAKQDADFSFVLDRAR